MAMIKCPECGKDISDRAKACPNCGYPIEGVSSTSNGKENKIKEKEESKPVIIDDKDKKPKKKVGCCGIIIWVVVIFVSLFVIIGELGSDNAETQKSTETKSINAENTKENESESQDDPNETDTEKNRKKKTGTFRNGMKEFSTGQYKYITNHDLDKYCSNMEGEKIYVVTDISDMKDGRIQSTLNDGFMMSNFYVGDMYEKYKEYISEGDTVAILGTVSDKEGYGFLGDSVNVSDCMVFAVGNEALKYKKTSSDEELSQYFVITEEVANSNDDISEDEYKSLCTKPYYEDILRNPDTYDGKYCVVSGVVDQIIEGFFDTFTIYIVDEYGNKWDCGYMYKDGESHLLEGDSVTLYGKCKGTSNSTTVLGQQVTMPYIDAEYLN